MGIPEGVSVYTFGVLNLKLSVEVRESLIHMSFHGHRRGFPEFMRITSLVPRPQNLRLGSVLRVRPCPKRRLRLQLDRARLPILQHW